LPFPLCGAVQANTLSIRAFVARLVADAFVGAVVLKAVFIPQSDHKPGGREAKDGDQGDEGVDD